MVILLDCRPFQYEYTNGEGAHFIISCLNYLSGERDIKCIFLVDSSYREGSIPGLSGRQIVTRRAIPGKAGWKLWFDWQIERVAKKNKADLVMTIGWLGPAGLSFPHCVWLPDGIGADAGNDKEEPGPGKKRRLNRIGGAASILTFSEKEMRALTGDPGEVEVELSGKTRSVTGNGIDSGRIFVLSCPPDEDYSPVSEAEREAIKNDYSGGKEYFFYLFNGDKPDERISLLKSFSLFKKRQKSNMQLIIAGSGISGDNHFPKKLETYKYKEDIHLFDHLDRENTASLMGGAYAFIYPFNPGDLGIPLLNAWKCGVPVISRSVSRARETGGDAVLYAQPGDPASLADQMMTIYKDENRRNKLIETGKARLKQFSREKSAERVWEAIHFTLQGFLKK